MAAMIDQRTTRFTARVPVDLAERAAKAARQARPGISRAGVIRLALARLAGLPDEYGNALPRTPYGKRPNRTDPS